MPLIVKMHRSPHRSVGCTIGLAPHVYVGAYGFNPLDALRGAAQAASGMIAAVNSNPALAAGLNLIAPGSSVALQALAQASATANQAVAQGASPTQAIQKVADAHGPRTAGLLSTLLEALL